MIISYSTIRSELNTGDLVLFSGKKITSGVIKLATLSKWSHVAIVVNMIEEYDYLTIWQSTNSNYDIKDLDTNKLRKGVILVPLSDYVTRYDGKISVRRLKGDLPQDSLKQLMKLRKELSRKKYEKNTIELIKAAYDGPLGHNNEDLSSIFCSELVAEAYQRLNLLTEDKPSNEYTPADFSKKRMTNLNNGFSLGDEIVIKNG